MQELSSIGLMPEDWGGDIPMVQVNISQTKKFSLHISMILSICKLTLNIFQQISALKGLNVDDLLETVMLLAEVSEMLLFI